jgi:hypothetical protein
MYSELGARRRKGTFIATLTAALGLFVIGYPLSPAAIRTMLLGYLLLAAGASRFLLGHRFKMARSAGTMRPAPVRSGDYTHYR